MLKYLYFLSILLLIGCGKNNQDSSVVEQSGPTPNFENESITNSSEYGSNESIKEYLANIEPLIKGYSQIQSEIYSARGSSGVFTGKNLGQKTKEQKPALVEVSDKLEEIEPPPLISPFHNEFKRLLALRISAFDAAIKAAQLEEASGDTAGFIEVTEKFALSDKQIAKLNDQMQKIRKALRPNEEKNLATP
ncbi:MAG: hypothetical protein VX294_10290 [Candidatus Latescibacterota bacterium]|nr:hypothetical protein [Candidatus Latescibacterota bacterium]